MNASIIRGVLISVGVLVSAAAGYVVRGFADEPEREKMNRENEALRTKLRSVLATFENENAKMEVIITKIVSNPPASLSELDQILRHEGLSAVQINRILDAVIDSHVYGDAA